MNLIYHVILVMGRTQKVSTPMEYSKACETALKVFEENKFLTAVQVVEIDLDNVIDHSEVVKQYQRCAINNSNKETFKHTIKHHCGAGSCSERKLEGAKAYWKVRA